MKFLLDSMMPDKIGEFFTGHQVTHVVDLGWQHLTNGELLDAADAHGFEILVTKDASMPYQQNLIGRNVSLVVLRPTTQDFDDLAALAPKVLLILTNLRPGTVHRVSQRARNIQN